MPRIQELGLKIPTTRRPALEYGMKGTLRLDEAIPRRFSEGRKDRPTI